MKSLLVNVSILLCLLLTIPGFAQGRLNQAKEDLKKEKEEKPEPTQQSNTEPNSQYEDKGTRSTFLNTILLPYYVLKLTKWTLFGKYKNEEHLHNSLTYYPYFDGASGNYLNNPADINPEPKRGRIDLSDNFLFSEDVYGNHLKLKLRPSKYFYLQVDYIALIEKIPTEKGLSGLNLYNFNFCYDRLRFNKFNLGWMMGVNYVASGVGKAGFTYGLNMEAFLQKNISLYTSFKGSKINGNTLNQLEIQGRFHMNRFFISPGYEMIQIGSSYFHFIAVGSGVYF